MEINFSMILFYKSDLLDIDAHSRLPMVFFSVFCAHLVFKKLNEISNVIFFQSPSFCLTLNLSKKKFGISSNWKQMSQRYHIF